MPSHQIHSLTDVSKSFSGLFDKLLEHTGILFCVFPVVNSVLGWTVYCGGLPRVLKEVYQYPWVQPTRCLQHPPYPCLSGLTTRDIVDIAKCPLVGRLFLAHTVSNKHYLLPLFFFFSFFGLITCSLVVWSLSH